MFRSYLTCFYYWLLELVWLCLFRVLISTSALVGYGVIWRVCVVVLEWERFYQCYLRIFGLRMGENPNNGVRLTVISE